MSSLENFLTPSEEQTIVDAIRKAEQGTSGEIRVHIEQHCNTDIYEHAIEVFYNLKMDNTKHQNAVLIYIAVQNKSFVIYGDKGVNDLVDHDFWNSTKAIMVNEFKSGNYKNGIVKGILEAGCALSEYFPYKYTDTNELDNTISKG